MLNYSLQGSKRNCCPHRTVSQPVEKIFVSNVEKGGGECFLCKTGYGKRAVPRQKKNAEATNCIFFSQYHNA